MSWKSFIKKPLFVIGGLFAVSSVAYAFPWDIDLVDTPYFRGYEWHMQSPAEGTVSVNHYRPHSYSDDLMAQSNNDNRVALGAYYGANMAELNSPLSATDAEVLNKGEVMFRTYCQTCHGVKGTVQDDLGENWEVSKRWAQPIPGLAMKQDNGKLLLSGGNKPDAMLYLYIRNGFGRMPAYGHAMSDEDIWSAVHYIKSLQGSDF